MKIAIVGRKVDNRVLMKLIYFYCCAFIGINIVISIAARDVEGFKICCMSE